MNRMEAVRLNYAIAQESGYPASERDYLEDVGYLLSRLEIAIQALEEYTEDEQHCARCDGMTYDTGNGKVAREALQQIRS